MSVTRFCLLVAAAAGLMTVALVNQLGHAGDWTSRAKYLEARGFLFGIPAAVAGFGLARSLVG
ncbi:MAG TPA: hypothetical protein VFK89_01305, partial [Actinomycetota bacterium]|nr:hypothetical protein [Actinomycetota bacterium]